MTPIPLSVPALSSAALDFLGQEAARQARYVRGHLGLDQALALNDAHRALSLDDRAFIDRWSEAIGDRFGPDVRVEIAPHQTGRPGELLVRAKQDRYPDDDLWCDVVLDEPEIWVRRRLDSFLRRR